MRLNVLKKLLKGPTWFGRRVLGLVCAIIFGCYTVVVFNGAEVNFDKFVVNFSRKYVEVGGGKFYIFSAIADSSLRGDSKWSSIVFNGWEEKAAYPIKYTCCYRYADGSYKSTPSGEKRSWLYDKPLMARQVICDISNVSRPEVVSLALPNEPCHNGTYQAPLYRQRDTESKFAICAKIAYGQKNPVEIIEWMEYHLLFGISKIVIYPYEDLNADALRVLKYYAKQGVLEIVAMPNVPKLGTFNRHFSVGTNQIMWQDEQVVNFDAQERLKQFKYYTLIDTDEFITQKTHENRTLSQLMDLMASRHNTTASFTMYSEIHMLDWPKTNNKTALKMIQYGNHTVPLMFEPKLLHVTNRLRPGSVWIHTSAPASGYLSGHADPATVVLKHFRYCKAKWARNKTAPCHSQFVRVSENILATFADRLEQKVSRVKRKLHLV